MKSSKILTTVLSLSGLLSVVVGANMVFSPVAFHANAGIVLDGSVNLTSEMRAAGGPLLVGGVIIVLGAFVERLKFAATLMASVLFLSYGSARIVSLVMDGTPSSALLQVTALEILVGVVSTVTLFKFYEKGAGCR